MKIRFSPFHRDFTRTGTALPKLILAISLAVNGLAGEGIQPAVLRSAVRSETVVKGGAERGGDLVIRRIEPPVFTTEELAAMRPAPPSELTEAEKDLRREALRMAREKAPLETRLFTPTVIGYPGQISLIRWWSWDGLGKEFSLHEVWVSGADMSLLPAVRDLNVGRRRWMLMAASSTAADRHSASAPSAAEFAASGTVVEPEGMPVLVEQGEQTPEALEPLTALLKELKTNGPQLAAIMAAWRASAEQEKIEAEVRARSPQPPAVIHFWTSDADEVSTLSRQVSGSRK